MSKDNQLGDIALDWVNGLGFTAARLAPMHLLHLKRLRKRQGPWWANVAARWRKGARPLRPRA